ncbi:macro domain-containing protein [Streptomyces sp. NPDC057136]|uniref:macro domain-containing protein n=1 Tax=Streptomyces sp. NPDC057136 TaxID=3346029 RepID=UPI00362DDD45
MASPTPDHAAVLHEIREVRRIGLVRLRGRSLPHLESAAESVAEEGSRARGATVEALLRRAVSLLDGGTLRTAAEYSLGLAQGTRDWPASSRRARAASLYGVSVERFRKDHEMMVLGQVAEYVVRLVAAREEQGAGAGAPLGDSGEWGVVTHRTVRVLAGGTQTLTVHLHPVDLLRDVDVVVSPANVHLALPAPYKSSVAASLRRAAAVRGVTGDVNDDPLHDELRKWAARHGTSGRAVLPGTVAATGSGAMIAQGVRRVYHAAIAVPRAGTNDYHVLPADVTRAVSRVFALLAEESGHSDPPLRSVCFPLLGSGRGGLPYHVSLGAVWAAVEAELARGASWDVHFVMRTREAAALVERIPAGIRPERARPTTG